MLLPARRKTRGHAVAVASLALIPDMQMNLGIVVATMGLASV